MRRIVYDTETCSRCQGSGYHSRCQRWGTTCFKCGRIPGLQGTGLQLTKQARKAQAKIEELHKSLGAVMAGDVKAGDVLRYDRRRRRVLGVEPGLPSKSRVGDGEWIEHPTIHIQFNGLGLCTPVDTPMQRALTTEQFDQVAALAATLKGARVETVEPAKAEEESQ